MSTDSKTLPQGVKLVPLNPLKDQRGTFIEIFRESWAADAHPLQWNVVHSNQNVLRGFHAHCRHGDYLLVVNGSMHLGLKDLRYASPTFGLSAIVVLEGRSPSAIRIPPGVGHAFYFPEPSLHIYSVTHYWDLGDELGCRWDDPGLELGWSVARPFISERDAQLPDLNALTESLNQKLSQQASNE